MKAYNGRTRGMLKVGGRYKSIVSSLRGKDIFDMIHEDKKLTKHRFNISFNAPEEVHYMDLKAHIFGPTTAQIVKDGIAFRDTLEYKPDLTEEKEYADIYTELTISMKAGNKDKYQAFVDKYQAMIDSMNPKKENIYIKLFAHDDKIVGKVFLTVPKVVGIPEVP